MSDDSPFRLVRELANRASPIGPHRHPFWLPQEADPRLARVSDTRVAQRIIMLRDQYKAKNRAEAEIDFAMKLTPPSSFPRQRLFWSPEEDDGTDYSVDQDVSRNFGSTPESCSPAEASICSEFEAGVEDSVIDEFPEEEKTAEYREGTPTMAAAPLRPENPPRRGWALSISEVEHAGESAGEDWFWSADVPSDGWIFSAPTAVDFEAPDVPASPTGWSGDEGLQFGSAEKFASATLPEVPAPHNNGGWNAPSYEAGENDTNFSQP